MTTKATYNFLFGSGCCIRCSKIIVWVLLSLFLNNLIKAQPADAYDAVSLSYNVQRIGSVELPALIVNEKSFLAVRDLFDFLKIRTQPSLSLDSISGFFIQPGALYVIDHANHRITYRNKVYEIPTAEMILTENNLYLKSDLLGQVFGLDCQFNFRSLSVAISSKEELPAIKEMQQELMRKNIIKLKGEKKADTLIARNYKGYHLGTADWAVVTTQESGRKAETMLNLSLGANLAGGEADVFLNYTNQKAVAKSRQFYRWKQVNNNNAVVKQFTVGKMFAPSTASIFAPVTGFHITNTPTTYRRSFGSYILSNTTEPGWMVELYVNNVLVNYIQADASGFYSFQVPLVYGNSIIKLRFFGPWGEERTREQNVTVPFNFLPYHQFEYNLSAGIVDDDTKGRFSRLSANYGLTKKVTIGAGVEYLSTIQGRKTLPFIQASVRVANNFLVSAEHTDGVQTKTILNYRLPSNIQVEAFYTHYVSGQQAINVNYLQEKKIMISMPFRRRQFTAFSRLTLSQITVPKSKYTSSELLFSGNYKNISTNITTNAWISDPKFPTVYSTASVTLRLPSGIRVTPQMQYDYALKKVISFKGEIEKRLFNNGFFNITGETNNKYKTDFISMGLRYNFAFAQTAITAQRVNKRIASVQSARGSIMYNEHSRQASFSNIGSIGKGGITLAPFLDVNCNGLRDPSEPRIDDLAVHINGGKMKQNKDSTISISNLEAYNNYLVQMDNNNFENIAWQIKKKVLSIAVDPNTFKLIEVPVMVLGEVSGTVYQSDNAGVNGISRIIINIYNTAGKLVGRTLSEADGYFSFLGLIPGQYYASIDSSQLGRLAMTNLKRNEINFEIKLNREGDVADGLEFVITDQPALAK